MKPLRASVVPSTFWWISAILVAATILAHTQQSALSNTAAVSGVVLDATTGKPVVGARVNLKRTDGLGASPRVLTDSKGRFVFKDLPAAKTYFLDAARFGYADTRYGWTGPGGSRLVTDIRQIALADGQWVSDISLPMWRYGSITGRVLDEFGEPVVGVAVRVFSVANIAGEPQPVAGPLATTDDRGVYRLPDLAPARYVVSVLSVQSTALSSTPESPQERAVGEVATGGISAGRGAVVTSPGIDVDGLHRLVVTNFATPPPPGGGQSRAYPAVFYPAAATAADATPIELGYGDDRSAIDVQLTPVAAARVSGHVDTGGGPVPRMLLRLMPRGSERLGFGAEAATTQVEPDGQFVFLNVPGGDYTLMAQGTVMDFTSGTASARLPDAPGFPAGGISVGSKQGVPGLEYLVRSGQTEPAWARLPVSVGTSEVAGLVLPMHPAVKIHGHIVFAEGATPPARSIIRAQPANGDPSLGNPIAFVAANDPTFAFTIEGLLSGSYLIDTMSFLAMAPVSVMWEGRDLNDTGFDGSLGRDFNDVVVTVTNHLAEISGTVTDLRGPVTAAVIAFPVERERWTNYGWEPLRLRSAPAGTTGSYRVERLPEGDYFVIAVDASHANAWVDPKFLAAAAPLATRVSVKWGEKPQVDLKVTDVVVK